MKLLFDAGDVVNIHSFRLGKDLKGQIVALRHAVGNHRTGSLAMGADVLMADGRVLFFFLHDIASWNKDKLESLS